MYIDLALREFNDHNQYIRGYSKDTARKFSSTVRMLTSIYGIGACAEVTEDTMRDFFYQGRMAKQWKPSTFRTYHKSLFVFFRWCVSRGYMAANPVTGIEIPKLEKRLPSKLNRQDALRLLEIVYNYPYTNAFLRNRNHAIFATFIYAGLRKSELLQLKYADVDCENLTIFVRQGKGAKDRIMPMGTALAHSLRRYAEERKRLKRTCPEFFASSNRNMGFTKDGLRHLTREIQRISGIPFSPHKLRHTFATLMLEGGCDIYSLSKMMGHSDITTTTIYLSASAELLRAQITKHPMN